MKPWKRFRVSPAPTRHIHIRQAPCPLRYAINMPPLLRSKQRGPLRGFRHGPSVQFLPSLLDG